jgi:hypothetical protein
MKMAKDGTNRGGARAGAGRKKKALADKISEGKTDKVTVLPTANLKGIEMPAPKEYLKAPQKNGQENYAVEIYEKTWNWLNEKGCAELVSPELIEHYAMTVSRWIQCQDAISNYGFLAKHPTTGAAIVSPYVNISLQYMKQANQLWYQIYQVVKENCSEGYSGANPQDDVMERLLRSRKG